MKALPVFFALMALGLAQTARTHWAAPAFASARQNPHLGRPELAAGGKKLFLKTCAGCHAAGQNQKGPQLSDPTVQEETDGALFWKISTGNSRTGMPAYGSLPEGQRWQLVLYIRNLAHPDVE